MECDEISLIILHWNNAVRSYAKRPSECFKSVYYECVCAFDENKRIDPLVEDFPAVSENRFLYLLFSRLFHSWAGAQCAGLLPLHPLPFSMRESQLRRFFFLPFCHFQSDGLPTLQGFGLAPRRIARCSAIFADVNESHAIATYSTAWIYIIHIHTYIEIWYAICTSAAAATSSTK